MNGNLAILRMTVGGAVCGAFLGIFAGGVIGGMYGWLFANVSVGLDSALIAGGAGCLGGGIYGIYQSFKGGDADRQSELINASEFVMRNHRNDHSSASLKRNPEAMPSETSRVST